MRFSKYSNPSRRVRRINHRSSPYSPAYIAEQKKIMFAELAKAETEEQRDAIIKAYDVTIHPTTR